MTRKWATRLLALCGLVLALGCRSHPATPCETPLLPCEMVSKAPVPETRTNFLPPRDYTKLPDVRPPTTIPPGSPDIPVILPPSDVAPLLTNQSKAVPGPQPRTVPLPVVAPVVKPLFVDPPRPPAGPDGFAPAPIIPPPEPPTAIAPAKPPVEVVKLMPLKPGEKFGHAADYKWVAGILDRHQKGGFWTIRYADSGDDDPWGGKVRLLGDDHLAGLASGDVVYMEGELLAPRSAADNAAYPPFRVTEVRLIEKGR